MAAKTAPLFSSPASITLTARPSASRTLASILTADVLALSAVYWLAVVGRNLIRPEYSLSFYLHCFPVLGLLLVAFWIDGLYPGVLLHPAEEIRRVFSCSTFSFLAFASFTFLSRNGEAYSRSVFLVTWAVLAPAVLLARYIVRQMASQQSWWGYSAVIVGSGPAGQRIKEQLRGTAVGIKVIGVINDNDLRDWQHDSPKPSDWHGTASKIFTNDLAHYAIVAVSGKSSSELRQTINRSCKGFRHILLLPDLPGICSTEMEPRELGKEVGLEVPQRLFHPGAIVAKRILDLILSSLIILSLAPIFLVIIFLIKAGSKGPVFFGHTRHGRHGEAFKALKFRTMVPDAHQVLAQFLRAHPELEQEWSRDHKLKDDPRITAVGKWLRRYSLDELPQLWNVLRGEMSLVGPRPIVNAEIRKYGNGYDIYSRVRPGLTGLWQVSGRNNTTYDERVAFDEYYVRNWSIWFDAYILARTVKVVITAEGAY